MPVLTKAQWIIDMLKPEVAAIFRDEDRLLSRNFDTYPDAVTRAKLQNWAANGVFPAQRTANERVEYFAETFVFYREWNDKAAAQEFVNDLMSTSPPALVSIEIIDL